MFILIGIIAAVFVVYIISKWWVDGLVSGMEFLALSVIYGGLVFGLVIVSSKKSIGPILIVLTPIIASVAWVIYNNQKFSLRQYYLEKIRDYELAIQADPRNIAARTMLAEAYYKLGELDSAIAAMEL
ncbi:MAG TPA: tetratricopeptide repeat protein, partial [Armatimonadota bacterium]|nr:tetratricopeptide repeat protein [Armatimonadota bacterium]